MSWQDILKNSGEEYRLYSLMERDILGLVKIIKKSKASEQSKENILQPIYEMMGGLKSASLGRGGDFSEIRYKIKTHLKQNISPLSPKLASRIARSGHLS